MWGRREEPQAPSKPSTQNTPPAPAPVSHQPQAAAPQPVQQAAAPKPVAPSNPEVKQEARLGKSLTIKGDISGTENLYVDGEVHGKIELKGHHVTVGPNGKVHADISARGITILGYLQGNLRAEEKVNIRQTGTVEGDLVTVGISIEEGAVFRGSIDIVKPGQAQASADAKPAPPQVKPAPLDSNPQRVETKSAQAPATGPPQPEHKSNQPDFKPGKPVPASQGNIKREAAAASKSM